MSNQRNNKRKRAQKNRGPKATQRRKASSRTYGRYWLTPRAWSHGCGRGCGAEQSVAYRASDHSYVCSACIERLGIKAQPSQSWREGGAGTDPSVRISFVDPEEMADD